MRKLSLVIGFLVLAWSAWGCQLPASYLQRNLKHGHAVSVEWYNYQLDPVRISGAVDLRFHPEARKAFSEWADTLITSPATGEEFHAGGRLAIQDFDGTVIEVFIPNDSINKLCRIKDGYFTQDAKKLDAAMIYLTLPTTAPAKKVTFGPVGD